MPTDYEIADFTHRILELERRIIALALATGHPELAAPFPDPGHAAAQRARDGVGLSAPFDTADDLITHLHRVTNKGG